MHFFIKIILFEIVRPLNFFYYWNCLIRLLVIPICSISLLIILWLLITWCFLLIYTSWYKYDLQGVHRSSVASRKKSGPIPSSKAQNKQKKHLHQAIANLEMWERSPLAISSDYCLLSICTVKMRRDFN